MTSIVAPAIDAEVEYRREQITKDFNLARRPRQRAAGRPRDSARAA
jgi:hypothetical protein